MAKTKTITAYTCDYCSFTTTSKETITKHETKCKYKPIDTIAIEIEQIRQTATSIPHLIQLLTDFLLSKGIEITFTNYPSNWDPCISNSHNAPIGYKTNWCGRGDAEGIPKSYPGWSGYFKGTIKVVDHTILNLKKNKDIGLNDLIKDVWSDSIMYIPYINTGSGSFGSSFDGSGMFWLYDFPLMYAEFQRSGDEYEHITNEFNKAIKEYKQTFNKNKSVFIQDSSLMKNIVNMQTELAALSTALGSIQSTARAHLEAEYHKLYPIQLPEIPSAFINIKAYHELTYVPASTPVPNTEAIFNKVKLLAATLDKYAKEHPEFII